MFVDAVETEQLPAGFTMRPGQLEDVEAIVALDNLIEEQLYKIQPYSVKQRRASWFRPKFQIDHSTRVVENNDGRLVGYIEVWDTSELPVRVRIFGRVHPAFEGLGIATALHDWAEGRAYEATTRVPDDIQVVANYDAMSEYTAALDFFKGRGLKESRRYWGMAIDFAKEIPEPKLPDGVTIRPWSEMLVQFELRDLVVAHRTAFRDHFGYVEHPVEEALENWEREFATNDHLDASVCFLAVNQVGEIVGESICETKSLNVAGRGYISKLSVVPAWRKQGIALALLYYTFGHFHGRGYKGVDLHVDAESLTGATRLYERAGMHEFECSIDFEKVIRPGRDIRRQ